MSPPDRYSRQERLPGIGPLGQIRIRRATVLVVGCGALGTHALDGLARAGVGRLLVVDRDVVEWSNLQRQCLFREEDAQNGHPKATVVAERLAEINAEVAVEAHVAHCSRDFLGSLTRRPDVVLDGTDNFATRYLLNDWCRREGLPWIYAGAVGSEAAARVFEPAGACLRCLWPEAPLAATVGTCETRGVLGAAIAAVAAFQVAETIKLLVGAATTRGLFTCDVWRGHYAVVDVGGKKAADCPICAHGTFPALAGADDDAVATLCGRDAVQILPSGARRLDLQDLANALAGAVADLVRTPHLVRFAAEGCRFSVFPGGRALVFGVADPLRARALYDRWIGA